MMKGEALGDSGMCLNLEYSFNSEKTSLFGAEEISKKYFFTTPDMLAMKDHYHR